MQSISYDTAKTNKLIRFMTPGNFMSTEDAFYIADGDRIRITSGYDGRVTSHICHYIDPYHFRVGTTAFHMDQFSEVMGKSGSTYEPEMPITDLSYYETKYLDRTLKDGEGRLVPYHEIIAQYDDYCQHKPKLSISVCPDADALRTVCIIQRRGEEFDKVFHSFHRLQERISDDLYSALNHWDRRTIHTVLQELCKVPMKQPLHTMLQIAAEQSNLAAGRHSEAPVHEPSR